jgi:hypothetical protein
MAKETHTMTRTEHGETGIRWGNRHRGEGTGYIHELGTTFDDPDITAEAAAREAGLDYTIIKRDLATRDTKGHYLKVPGAFALLSDYDGSPEVIAVVGKEFEPVQNMHLAEMLDRAGLTGPGGLYSLDVAGKTADGRTVFWSLKDREDFTINGDRYRNHWVILDGKDGNRALGMALTPIRFICSNALQAAVSGASIKVGISHTANAQKELAWWLSIAPKLQAAAEQNREVLSRMGSIVVDEPQIQQVLEAAYPVPALKGRAQLYASMPQLQLSDDDAMSVDRAYASHGTIALRQLKHITNVTQLFRSYDTDPDEGNIAGTLLGVVNAVTDYENHREATSVRENAALSNLTGPRYLAQVKAMRAAVALAK